MAVVYRTDGPWGSGLGTNLTAPQVDNNFWELVQRLTTLETRTPATDTLTLTGNALNNQTVTIGIRVYTWKTTLTGAANEVKIGASASASLDNLIAAINAAAGEGTTYGTGTTVNTLVEAVAGAGDTMDITARVPGENGNTIAVAETMTNGSWATPTLEGGVGIGADNIESISVIGSQMTIFMQSGFTFGPFTLPIAMIRWRGEWAPAIDYAELDLVLVPATESFPGVYLVLEPHTSESIFDPAQVIGGNPVYQKLFAISGEGPLNFRGSFEDAANYAINDMFVGPETSYVVLQDHVSVAPFDPNRLIGGLPVYIALIPPIPPTEEPTSNIWDPVELATSGNVALTGEQTIDGVMSAATPVLVRDNTDKAENGIWVTAAGAWARRADANDAAEFEYAKQVLVMNGTTFGGSIFYLNTADPGPYVIGTTPLTFNELAAPDRATFIQIETAANVTLKRKRHSRRAVRMNRPTAQNFNMDNTDGFGAGRGFNLEQIGAGAVTVVASGGVTIERPSGMSLTLVRYVVYGFFKIDATTWRMNAGDGALGGGGSSTFTGLSDVPASYSSQGKKHVRVNAAETALEFIHHQQPIMIAASDESAALTTGQKVTLRAPFAFKATGIRGSLKTAQSSGSIFTVDVKESGTTILSTLLTIDNTEKTSTSAATAAVISDPDIADDAEMTFHITQVGAGDAVGLKVYLYGYDNT